MYFPFGVTTLLYQLNINNPNLNEGQRNEIIQRKDEMKDMIQQVQLATAIKTIGTGTAGAFSQKGMKITRDNEPLNTLEITYGATQGILQAKHDALQAERHVRRRPDSPSSET